MWKDNKQRRGESPSPERENKMKTLGTIKGHKVVYDEKNGTMFIKGTTIATYNIKSQEEALEYIREWEGFKEATK